MKVNTLRTRQSLEMLPCRTGLVGQSEYQKFIIVGSRRTGTNFLLHLLRSSGQVAGFAELFSKVGPFWAGRAHAPLRLDRAKTLRDRDAVGFLEHDVFRLYPSAIRAVGFKAHYGQLEAFPPALKQLQLETDLVVLHIRRTNMLSMEVSAARAQVTGTYLQAADDTSTDETKVALDVEALGERFERYEANASWPQEHLPAARTIDIEYEQLSSDPRRTMEPIMEALGLHGADLAPGTARQNTLGWRDTVLNVSEVEHELTDTKWAYLLDLPT